MNYTIDMVTAWADKLTYRICVLSGMSDEQLQNVLKAFVDKQNGVTAADDALQPSLNLFGIKFKNIGDAVLKIGLGVVAVIVAWYLYKRDKRR